MAKISRILIGVVVAGCALGGLAFAADAFIDNMAKKQIEEKLSTNTGLEVNCAKTDVNLLQQSVKVTDIRSSNVETFPSSHLFTIGGIEIESKGLNSKPLQIEKMVIQDVAMNLDIKVSGNPRQGQEAMEVNMQQLSQPTASNSQEPEMLIEQMDFNNIQINVNAEVPFLGEGLSQTFQIGQLTLMDVTSNNMQEKLATALQTAISSEIANQQGSPQLQQVLGQAIQQMPKPSIPSPEKPSLPSPSQPSIPSPEKPSIPSSSQPSPPAPEKPSAPSPSQPSPPAPGQPPSLP